MKYLKNTLISLIIILSSNLYGEFEQSSIESGNLKLSLSLMVEQDRDSDIELNLFSQVGYFMSDRVEVTVGMKLEMFKGDLSKYPTPGFKKSLRGPHFNPQKFGRGKLIFLKGAWLEGIWGINIRSGGKTYMRGEGPNFPKGKMGGNPRKRGPQ